MQIHLTLADACTVHGAMFLGLLRRGYNFYQTNGFYAGITLLLMLNVLLIFILIHIQMLIVDCGL